MIDFIIWNGSPILFSMGPFVLRWYGVLFIIGFFVARMMLVRMYKKDGHSRQDVETLTRYLLIAVIVGARLGFVLLYQPHLIWTKPLEGFLPIGFTPAFHFMGLDKLSVHGALLGVLIAVWMYSRKKNRAQPFLAVLDRMSLPIVMAAIFLAAGSFLDSEIVGKPTQSSMGVVSARSVTDGLVKVPCCIMRNPGGNNPLDVVMVKKDTTLASPTLGHSPILLYLFFDRGATEQLVNEFLIGDVKTFLFDNSKVIYEPGTEPLHYTIFQEKADIFTARIRTIGIARHPTQLYELVAFVLLLITLFLYWKKYHPEISKGTLSGIFLITFSLLFVATGFLKEDRAAFEKTWTLSMGQLVNIPFLAAGILILFYTWKFASRTKKS